VGGFGNRPIKYKITTYVQTWARVIRIDSGTLLNKYLTQSENNK
jgi:hypothetical protein